MLLYNQHVEVTFSPTVAVFGPRVLAPTVEDFHLSSIRRSDCVSAVHPGVASRVSLFVFKTQPGDLVTFLGQSRGVQPQARAACHLDVCSSGPGKYRYLQMA